MLSFVVVLTFGDWSLQTLFTVNQGFDLTRSCSNTRADQIQLGSTHQFMMLAAMTLDCLVSTVSPVSLTMMRPLLTNVLFSRSFSFGSATRKVCEPAIKMRASVRISKPGLCQGSGFGLTSVAERHRGHVRLHLENFLHVGRHLDDSLVAKVNRLTLLGPGHALEVDACMLSVWIKGEPVGAKINIGLECRLEAWNALDRSGGCSLCMISEAVHL